MAESLRGISIAPSIIFMLNCSRNSSRLQFADRNVQVAHIPGDTMGAKELWFGHDIFRDQFIERIWRYADIFGGGARLSKLVKDWGEGQSIDACQCAFTG